ncbi:hypothetical protein [Methylobacterium nigriterrae]|uniref:hypothetical protein n=1 Tax=Methylobacterium nigriterrae TaxID=3127512 RepID=UPI003013F0CE
MSFAYTVSLNDPANSLQDGDLLADVRAAASEWAGYLNGLGSLDIQVNVSTTSVGRANGGTATVVPLGADGSRQLIENGTIHELKTGIDPNGTAPDLIINVDPNYLKTLWLNPSSIAAIPNDKIDGISVFTHEIAHGLGIQGYRDLSTGSLGAYESTWDKLVTTSPDGSASFTGANSVAVYGGPVSVTTTSSTQNYFHLGNSVNEADGQDLMNGIVFKYGVRYDISKLDLAIMKDLGLTTNGSDLNSVYRFFDTATQDHFYTTSAVEKNQILATQPSYHYEGAAWAAPDKSAATIDVFRFFDSAHNSHFFTTSVTERDHILQTLPSYKYEGVAFQAYADASAAGPGALTLERFFNTNTGLHHYSASASETYGINHGTAGAGWIDEGPSLVVHAPTDGMLFA